MPTTPASQLSPASVLTCDAPPVRKRRGNPNLNLSPRCGARTRAGRPCQSPAVFGRQRCRMHGGRSTGPRTPEGLARLRAARTVHGRYGAAARTRSRQVLTIAGRTQTHLDALNYQHRLPAELAARLHPTPPEFTFPPFPAAPLTAAQDRAMQQSEAAALAPWKQAIATIREADQISRMAARAHAPESSHGSASPERSGRHAEGAGGEPEPVSGPSPSAPAKALTTRLASSATRPLATEAGHDCRSTAGLGHVQPLPALGLRPGGAAVAPLSVSRPMPAAPPPAAPAQPAAGPLAPEPRSSGPSPTVPAAPAEKREPEARPLAPVATPPSCCLRVPCGSAAAAPQAGRRQHLLAGTGAGNLALFQAVTASLPTTAMGLRRNGRGTCRP